MELDQRVSVALPYDRWLGEVTPDTIPPATGRKHVRIVGQISVDVNIVEAAEQVDLIQFAICPTASVPVLSRSILTDVRVGKRIGSRRALSSSRDRWRTHGSLETQMIPTCT